MIPRKQILLLSSSKIACSISILFIAICCKHYSIYIVYKMKLLIWYLFVFTWMYDRTIVLLWTRKRISCRPQYALNIRICAAFPIAIASAKNQTQTIHMRFEFLCCAFLIYIYLLMTGLYLRNALLGNSCT